MIVDLENVVQIRDPITRRLVFFSCGLRVDGVLVGKAYSSGQNEPPQIYVADTDLAEQLHAYAARLLPTAEEPIGELVRALLDHHDMNRTRRTP